MLFPYIAENNSAEVPCYIVKKEEYKNHLYVIFSIQGRHPTAYVRVNESEKWYDMDYDKISSFWMGCKPHGGFTFSGFVSKEFNEQKESYWVGWDYAHYGDYESYPLNGILAMINGAKKWTIEEIEADCTKVIDYMESLYESPNNE